MKKSILEIYFGKVNFRQDDYQDLNSKSGDGHTFLQFLEPVQQRGQMLSEDCEVEATLISSIQRIWWSQVRICHIFRKENGTRAQKRSKLTLMSVRATLTGSSVLWIV